MCSLPIGTITLLFTDIEGSTRLLQRLGDTGYAQALENHRRLLREAFDAGGGRELETQGDGFLVAFPSARGALLAAIAAQRAIMDHSWPDGVAVRVRMGLHTGEPVSAAGGYVGLAVHRAARICTAGHGGQILLSQTTRDLVEQDLSQDTTLRDLGAHRLKDLQRPEHIYQVVYSTLSVDFPPLKTLDTRPNNLSTQPTPLIGREREVEEARAQLLREDVRLLTLSGPGGTGKTRLGLQVAADLLDDFEHGVYFVALAPISDPTLVASTVAQALSLREAEGRPLLEILKDYLRDKQMLLLLDNFEHLVSAAPMVADLLAGCSRLKVLVTSRAPLHLRGEQEFPVPPLSLPNLKALQSAFGAGHLMAADVASTLSQHSAVALFVQRALGVKPDFAVTSENAPAVAEICHRLDGLPLAIELAAARIKLLPPEAMLARLQSRLRLLTGGPRDLPARQQTLKDAIAWSYNLLDESEMALFRRLSVFAGGFTIDAAEAVCNGAGGLDIDVLDEVASLTDKSLLRQEEVEGEPRFTMLETIREFGLERLAASEEESVRRGHGRFFLALAEEAESKAGQDIHRWFSQFEREHDNLRAALAWSRDQPDGGETWLRLAGALGWFWYQRGYCSEGRRWLEGALTHSIAMGRTRRRAKALYGAGSMAFCQDDHPAARVFHAECMAIARDLGDRWLLARALGGLALNPDRPVGQRQAARPLLEESLAIFRELGDQWEIARTLTHLAPAVEDEAMARTLLEESLAIAREVGEKGILARALLGLGGLASRRGDYVEARLLLEESLGLRREAGETWGTAFTLNVLGEVMHLQGDYDRATAVFQESLALFRDMGNRPRMASTLHNLGRVALCRGDNQRAAALFQESLALHRLVGNQAGVIEYLAGMAEVAAAQGKAEPAVRMFGAVEALREATGAPLRPVERIDHAHYVAAARDGLGEEAFAAAWARGRAMTLEQAIQYSLTADT